MLIIVPLPAQPDDAHRHLFYSDPNHVVNDEPCGEPDVADAVRGFRQTIPVVANRIGDWQPVGDFVLDAPAQVNEGETVTITITRTGQTDSAQTVELVRLFGQGMNESDVQGLEARTKVTFAEGETQKTVTFTVAQDDVHEPNDDIQFWLANTGNYRGGFVPTVLMIHDDDEQSSGGGNNNTGNTGGSSGSGGGGAAWWLTLLALAGLWLHGERKGR
ncbi:MAG: hypothetical protein D6694_07180 [Gammaproteobacteria bacterium]|nr:MAG: hypothetical protein D6694_07180 [Gammaproteobacteria bacterium]